jgi:TP901 family phage tail tape measure protein
MAATYELGTARGRIDIETSSAERNLAAVGRKQDQLSKNQKDHSAALRTTGIAMAGIGVAAVAGFGAAINVAANFEKGISAIGAVSGATQGELDQLRQKALQLGADTAFSASEAAGAMEALAKAGISTTDILGGAADATVALAAAGEVDLTTAAEIASNAMNQFSLSAGQMPHIADLIAGAANASAIDVTDFGMSMAQAGATANLVGLSFDDMAVAITAMGNAGIKGSDAGTSLKTFLSNLQPTTKKQTELMKELGLITAEGGNQFFDAAGHVKSMADIGQTLQDSLKGMTDAQKSMALETIFGSDAIRAAAVVAKEGGKGFKDLAAQMAKVKAADVAKKRLDNFAGSMEQLKGSVETLVIQIGTPFLGVLKKVVDQITKVVNVFSAMPEPMRNMIAFAVLAAGALVGLAGAILLAFSYFKKIQVVLQAMKIGTLLTNPVFLAIAAIALLAFGLFLLYQKSKAVRDFLDGIFDAFRPAIEAVTGFVQKFVEEFQKVVNAFKAGKGSVDLVAQAIDRWLGGTGEVAAVINAVSEALKSLFEAVDKVVNALGGWNKVLLVAGAALLLFLFPIPAIIAGLILLYAKVKIVKTIVDAVAGFVNRVVEAFGGWQRVILVVAGILALLFAPLLVVVTALIILYQKVKLVRDVLATVGRAVQAAAGFIQELAGVVAEFATEFGGWFNENVMPTLKAFGALVAAVVKLAIKTFNALNPVFVLLGKTAQIAFGIIMTIVKVAMNIIVGQIKFALGFIKILWDTFGDNIVNSLRIAFDTLKLIVETVLGIIRGIMQIITGLITGDWSLAWEGVLTILTTIWDAIKGIVRIAIATVRNIIDEALSFIRLLWESTWLMVRTILSTAMDAIGNIARGAMDVFKATIQGAVDSVVGFFQGLPGRILGFVGDVKNAAMAIGSAILSGIKDGITGALGVIGDFERAFASMMKGAWNKVIDAMNSVANKFEVDVGPLTIGLPDNIFNLLKLAKGGIAVRQTLALLGESGKEAVIPLRKLEPMMASALVSAGGGNAVTLNFNFGDVTGPNGAQQIQQAVTSPEVLQEILRTVRSGRR